jgi:glycosyltransferase involved in cell wall biosynthesis
VNNNLSSRSRTLSESPTGDLSKTVLVIASRFPPVASVGAIRVRKFVKYLPQYGWQPVVITGATRQESVNENDARRAVDRESLDDLPSDLPIHRLSPALDHWPTHLVRACDKPLSTVSRLAGVESDRIETWMTWRLEQVHDGLAFPDRGIWRLPAAVRLALRLHKRYRFNAIFSSGMPFSDHLIGLALHSILRKPWLADFRDPWVEYIHWQQWHSDWGHRLTRWAESAVVRNAARVISVNDQMTARFEARYAGRAGGKFVTISNGFDPADFPAGERPTNDRFRLLYAGSLYQTRSPTVVLEAFRRFLASVPGSREHAKFDFAGRPGPYVEEFTRDSDGGTIEHLGVLPHSQALRGMTAADVNVILLPDLPGSESDTTTKLYECLGSGRAILAVVPSDGAAARVLDGHDGVWRRDPNDAEGIAEAIKEMYERWLSGRLDPNRPGDSLKSHLRRQQAADLAGCLDAVASPKQRCRR